MPPREILDVRRECANTARHAAKLWIERNTRGGMILLTADQLQFFAAATAAVAVEQAAQIFREAATYHMN